MSIRPLPYTLRRPNVGLPIPKATYRVDSRLQNGSCHRSSKEKAAQEDGPRFIRLLIEYRLRAERILQHVAQAECGLRQLVLDRRLELVEVCSINLMLSRVGRPTSQGRRNCVIRLDRDHMSRHRPSIVV